MSGAAPAGPWGAPTSSSRPGPGTEATARGRVREIATVVGVMAGAMALRAWHAGGAMPDHGAEPLPLRIAVGMRPVNGRIDWDPRWFSEPSLGVYLQLFVQQVVYLAGRLTGAWANAADHRLAFMLDPTPMLLGARALLVVCDALSVLAAWRLGERLARGAGPAAAVLVACSALSIEATRAATTDPITIVLMLWSLERAMTWHARGGPGRFASAAALAGLATGAGYVAGVVLLPIVWLAWGRGPRRGLLLAGLGVAIAACTFLLSTPFAILDPAAFGRDVDSGWMRVAVGGWGGGDPAALAGTAADLTRALGWPALVLLVASPGLVWRDRDRRAPWIAAWLALLAFSMVFALAGPEVSAAPRAMAVLAAPLAAAGAWGAMARMPAWGAMARMRMPTRGRRALAAALMVALVAVPLASGLRAAGSGGDGTRDAARRWCDTHLRDTELMISEAHGPDLLTESRLAAMRGSTYRSASPRWRARVDRLRWHRVVALPAAMRGSTENTLALAGLPPVSLEVDAGGSALERIFAEPSLYADADYVLTTDSVDGRPTAAPAPIDAVSRLHRMLETHAPVAARFRPGGPADGPEIVIYRIDPAARAALRADGGLDPLWWTAAIPRVYRRVATRLLDAERRQRDSLLTTPGLPPRGALIGSLVSSPRALAPLPDLMIGAMADLDSSPLPGPRDPKGEPSPWVRSLAPLYRARVATFAGDMAYELATLGRYDAAARFAEANLLMSPGDVLSCLVASVALARLDRWPACRATIERTLAVRDPAEIEPPLELQYARALAHTGDPGRAIEIDRRLIGALPGDDPVAAAARSDLARLR